MKFMSESSEKGSSNVRESSFPLSETPSALDLGAWPRVQFLRPVYGHLSHHRRLAPIARLLQLGVFQKILHALRVYKRDISLTGPRSVIITEGVSD
ncbi:hypothetical protein TNCT_218341 [Trichonephila clavata]|uniref:Uncharacterized protein n=1 Tax=Trichonephila clavata TaxID=2740835 RepID=A0A8X6F4W0_TRICU|nr:hypothetical protein TNCT_218341 [Trichonephila clavata]